MKTRVLLVLHMLCLAVSLPMLSTPIKARETSAVNEARPQDVGRIDLVWFADGHLTVRAQDVSLGELLDEIARKSGLTVVRHIVLEQKVTLELHRVSLERALQRVLRHRSFVLEYVSEIGRAHV